QAVVALGQLGLQHLAVLGPDVIEAVLLRRDADAALKALGVGGHVDKGKLEMHRAVKEVEKAAPLLENSGLVLLEGELVVDVLNLDGAGVVAVPHPAGAVGKHPLKGNGLLGGAGDAVIAAGRFHDAVDLLALSLAEQGLTGGLFAAELFEQCASPPPGRLPAASGRHSSCWCGKVGLSAGQTGPDKTAGPPPRAAGRCARTSQRKRTGA